MSLKIHCSEISTVGKMMTTVKQLTVSNKWDATWQNQQSECAFIEDSDQPGHPPSLIRVFAVHMKKPWALSYPLIAQRRLWSAWADLSLRWAHTFTLLVLSCHGSNDVVSITDCLHLELYFYWMLKIFFFQKELSCTFLMVRFIFCPKWYYCIFICLQIL